MTYNAPKDIGNWKEFKFKFTPTPPPDKGAIYRCDYTPFWAALQWITATINDWVSERAYRHAIFTRLPSPCDGIKVNLQPCASPYCECEEGKCTHPGFYDNRAAAAKQIYGIPIDQEAMKKCKIRIIDNPEGIK